jgi:hypothetical protein
MRLIVCRDCGQTKPSAFATHKRRGLQNQCKECRAAYNREHYQKNKERYKESARLRRLRVDVRDDKLKQMYGISGVDYEIMLKKQGGVCAICKRSPNKKRLAVDHCHKTNMVRGLLCLICNVAVGLLKDDPALLESALEYLRSWSGTSLPSKGDQPGSIPG